MRVLIFHGYLLRGTGSNVYNARLAAALARLGHDVEMVCQDRDAAAAGLADVGPGAVSLHVPDIGGLLPVYVADRYEGFEVKTFLECSDAEIGDYLDHNVETVRRVVAETRPDVALANHTVMGPAILARALGDDVPYAVKVHGSALEYGVKRDPERFGPFAREGLAPARGVLVGSLHTAQSLWGALPDLGLEERTRLGPPGVEVDEFVPRDRGEAAERVQALAARLRAAPGISGEGSFARDDAAAGQALASLDPAAGPLVAFVGKLILSKGVDLLAAAWPLVLARVPDARLVVVGFGAFREGFDELVAALGRGDLDHVRDLAERGRAAEGGPAGRLDMLSAFLASVDDAYLAAARRLPAQVTVVGRLDHAELAELLPLCEALIVPSTFPEAFGMVAAEAAACGVLPVGAAHSGLAEVAEALAAAAPPEARGLLSFPLGPDAVRGLADRIVAWLEAPDELRSQTRKALVATTRELWSWEGVARGVLAAAQGQLDELPSPA